MLLIAGEEREQLVAVFEKEVLVCCERLDKEVLNTGFERDQMGGFFMDLLELKESRDKTIRGVFVRFAKSAELQNA